MNLFLTCALHFISVLNQYRFSLKQKVIFSNLDEINIFFITELKFALCNQTNYLPNESLYLMMQ